MGNTKLEVLRSVPLDSSEDTRTAHGSVSGGLIILLVRLDGADLGIGTGSGSAVVSISDLFPREANCGGAGSPQCQRWNFGSWSAPIF